MNICTEQHTKKNTPLTINIFAIWRSCKSDDEFNPKFLFCLALTAKYIFKYKTLLNIIKKKNITKFMESISTYVQWVDPSGIYWFG